MLTFLAIASRKRFVLDEYRDEAVGILGKDAAGRLAITKVTLRPKVPFSVLVVTVDVPCVGYEILFVGRTLQFALMCKTVYRLRSE